MDQRDAPPWSGDSPGFRDLSDQLDKSGLIANPVGTTGIVVGQNLIAKGVDLCVRGGVTDVTPLHNTIDAAFGYARQNTAGAGPTSQKV